MKRSPVTAHVVIVYHQEDEVSTAFLEDDLERRRKLFSCTHRQVVAEIAKWAQEYDYDQCEIRCERNTSGQSTSTVPHSDDPQNN